MEPDDVGRQGAAGRGDLDLIGVYPDQDGADVVRDRALALGVTPDAIRIGDRDDYETALEAEMQDEASELTGAGPAGVVYPKETVRSMKVLGPVIVLITVVVALPFALIGIGDLPLWGRLLLVGGIAAAFGLAITVVVAPAVGLKRPDEPLAADRGVVVRVSGADDQVQAMMVDLKPIRLDRIQGTRTFAVVTEDLSAGTGIIDEIVRGGSRPRQETEPGYPPPRPS